MEVWKTIDKFPNYEVSNEGKVRSKDYSFIDKKGVKQTHKGKELKLATTDVKFRKGYKQVYLYDDNHERHTVFVHRLVAIAFIPNPNQYKYINHIDEDTWNNNVTNLEWCTAKYNSNYGHRNANIILGRKLSAKGARPRIKDLKGSNSEKQKSIIAYNFLDNSYIKYSSLKECSFRTGVDISKISAVMHHSRNYAGNYIFGSNKSEIKQEDIISALKHYTSYNEIAKQRNLSKILAMGDVHLTNYSVYNSPTSNPLIGSRLFNILKAIKFYFEYGRDHNIFVYVINGDLFDKRRSESPSLVAYLNSFMVDNFRNITPYGSQLILNVGNHEEGFRTLHPNSLENFRLYSIKGHLISVCNDLVNLFRLDSKRSLVFIPYTEKVKEQKVEIQKQFKEYDKTSKHITVFAHLGVDGAIQGRWSHRLSDAYNLDDLGWNDENVKSICLSHFHKRQTLLSNGHKEAYYMGDLTELNFNDIQEDGTGAPRGFEEIDTTTGEHKLIDLTKEPYNIPTFNQIDLDEGSNLGLSMLNPNSYYKITTRDKETYEHLSKERESLENASNIQLVLIPQQIETQLDIDPTSSDKELVANYCEKNYPELKDKALDYLRRAKEN